MRRAGPQVRDSQELARKTELLVEKQINPAVVPKFDGAYAISNSYWDGCKIANNKDGCNSADEFVVTDGPLVCAFPVTAHSDVGQSYCRCP
jgi:hypothetical protein